MKIKLAVFGLGIVITMFTLAGCETHVHEVQHEGTVVSEQMVVE